MITTAQMREILGDAAKGKTDQEVEDLNVAAKRLAGVIRRTYEQQTRNAETKTADCGEQPA